MTALFWSLGAGMLILALLFVLLPLLRPQASADAGQRRHLNIVLRREQLAELEKDRQAGLLNEDEFKQAKQELEINLLADIDENEDPGNNPVITPQRRTLLALTVLLPVFVIGLYLKLGDPKMLEPPATANAGMSMESVEEMMEQLRARLENEPGDGEGWIMLARSYLVTDQPAKAADAYRNARKVLGDEPALLADFAEALILANKFQVNGETVELIKLALSLNPEEPKALWVAGFAELVRGNAGQTLELWRILQSLLPADSEEASSLKDKIAEVEAAMKQPADGSADETTALESDSVQTASITVAVELDPALKDQVRAEQLVYVFARAASGPRMPLAVARKQVKDLPFSVTLDDSMAMTPAMRLSGFEEVVISARVSQSGEAIPASGDFSGSSQSLRVGEVKAVSLTIDKILP